MTTTGKQLFTTLTEDGTLTLEIAEKEFADPKPNQVLVNDGFASQTFASARSFDRKQCPALSSVVETGGR